MSTPNPIEKAIAVAGGQSALAALLDCSPQAVLQWKRAGKAPVLRCLDIERVTGGQVTRRDLRPNDWMLVWPELAASAQSLTQAA